jgi:hypothetical protein
VTHHLTGRRTAATMVTALAADADDARDLLLALGLIAPGTAPTETDAPPADAVSGRGARPRNWTRAANLLADAGATVGEIAYVLGADEVLAGDMLDGHPAGVQW